MKNNQSFYVALVVLAAAAVAKESSRSKKEAGYTPHRANTDVYRYLGTAGYSYYNQQQSYSQPEYPYNKQYNQQYNHHLYNQPHNQYQYNQPYNQPYSLPQLPYQWYNDHHSSLNYPYNINQHSQLLSQQPYNNQAYEAYAGQRYPYTGYQIDQRNGYLPGYDGAQENVFGGYPNSVGYNHFGFRQAPDYPSPGFQPVRPPAPHPFYHTQGTYYPSQTTEAHTEANTEANTEAYKPVAVIDPRKIYK